MREIALHLLDIAENSVAAQARNITMDVREDLVADRLSALIEDDGRGMDPETVKRVCDPFMTSRLTRKVGLGIPLLKAAAEACRGFLEIDSQPGEGTRLEVEFQESHIDRMPLGDLAGTWLTLIIAYPQIHWVFRYRVVYPNPASGRSDEKEFVFDSQPVQEALGDIPFSEPDVLAYLRSNLEDGVASVQNALPEMI